MRDLGRERKIADAVYGTLVLSATLPTLNGLLQAGEVIRRLSARPVDAMGHVYGDRVNFIGYGTIGPDAANTANAFALYLGIVLLYLVFWLYIRDNGAATGSGSVMASLYCVVLGVLIILTFSRRVWITFVLLALFFLYRLRSAWVGLLLVGAVSALLFFALPAPIREWIVVRGLTLSDVASEASLSTVRLTEWAFMWEEISQSARIWLVGDGFGTVMIASKGMAQNSDYATIQGHNHFLSTWFQLGLIGVGLFSLMVLEATRSTLRLLLATRDAGIKRLSWTHLFIMLLFFVSALSASAYSPHNTAPLFWIVLGLMDGLSLAHSGQPAPLASAPASVRA